MRQASTAGWVSIRLSSTTLWIQEPVVPDLIAVTGVRSARPTEVGWEADALVPGDRWQPLSGTPAATGAAAFCADRDVALVRLPEVTRLERWRDRGRRLSSRVRRCRELPWSHVGRFVVRRCKLHLDVRRRRPDPRFERRLAQLGTIDRYMGDRRDIPGLATLAAADDAGRPRVGLHLDNWDGKPVKERNRSRNRASLNLGHESRWFLFVDHDVVALHDDDATPTTVSARRLVDPRSLTVVRVRVPPGWAYIAPTENLLHDAYTVGQERGARHASALGGFAPPLGPGDVRVTRIEADLAIAQPARREVIRSM